ncbi:hypothetical protein P3342_002107 [Pyrenophora teres f. teres]|nr:hypothetical protein P3342_002107 [Pyrenophora teres f. teres]
MLQGVALPESRADVEVEELQLLRRSPHPYLRHRDQVRRQSPNRSDDPVLQEQTPYATEDDTMYEDDGRRRRKPTSQSPSESGTEADDEGCSLVKRYRLHLRDRTRVFAIHERTGQKNGWRPLS